MSNKNKQKQMWVITVPNGACGTGAGGLQFANGRAECFDERIANWYKSRGYTVTIESTKAGNITGKNQDTKEPEQQADLTQDGITDPDKTTDPQEPNKESV